MDELGTRTSEGPRNLRQTQVVVPYLYLVLECSRPTSPGVRICLADIARIEVGRAGARAWARQDGSLRFEVPDRFMSQKHAEIFHAEGRSWTLRDLGSKNGTFVGGQTTTEVTLNDGDVIEIGRTFFQFRLEQPVASKSIVDGAALPGPPGLRTLIPSLEQSFGGLVVMAAARSPLVILGETGVGKEVVARAVHSLSRRIGAFVGVNCGALPANLVESELFGSKKGAFSGATEDRVGLVRTSDKGTLLLDEIGDLPASSQVALLRTLQEGEVRPVGGTRPVPVDLRVLAATHHDLEALVKKGRFRADLLARLSGFTVRLPPLRERIADFGLLVSALAARIDDGAPFAFTPEAARALLTYPWPMNIRELEQALRAALVLAGLAGGEIRVIDVEHLPEAVRTDRSGARPTPRTSPTTGKHARRDPGELAERREAFIARMKEHQGNVSAIARALGIARMQVHRWIRQYGVDPEDYRPGKVPTDAASSPAIDDPR